MKKLLIINGSQSKQKAGRQLVELSLEHLKEKSNLSIKDYQEVVDGQWSFEEAEGVELSVLYMDLKPLSFKGCIDCGYCAKRKGCMLRDDLKYMYRYFDEMDYLLVVSPVYFDGTPWKLKALVDRMQAVYHSKYTLMDSLIRRDKQRFGLNIFVGGEACRDSQFVGIDNVMSFFYRAINTQRFDRLTFSDTDRLVPVEDKAFVNQVIQRLERLLNL